MIAPSNAEKLIKVSNRQEVAKQRFENPMRDRTTIRILVRSKLVCYVSKSGVDGVLTATREWANFTPGKSAVTAIS